jgi:hypothetical protein
MGKCQNFPFKCQVVFPSRKYKLFY